VNAIQKPLAYLKNVRFEVFTAVTMKNAFFWDVMVCDVSDECSTSIIRVTVSELGTLAITSNRRMLRRNTVITDIVFLVRTDVSEERSASIIGVTRIRDDGGVTFL
jgi:hypothetical protein